VGNGQTMPKAMNTKIAIAGIAGRMGQALLRAVLDEPRADLAGGSERPGGPMVGQDIATLVNASPDGLLIEADVKAAARASDVWIDFTLPEATLAALQDLRDTDVRAVIIGTTGFDSEGQAAIKAAAQHFAIVQSGNFSLGINLLSGLVRQAAERLGPDWDAEIIEAHHNRKIDAPSGTALMLGQAVAEGRGIDHDEHAQWARHGRTGERREGDIGYAVVRAGGIIGDHEVLFATQDEHIKLSHYAHSRTIFARGALVAALWAATKPPGLYTMGDVLGL
jgi:4-hydroxy-tetrahydrodipicolinate reductase